MVLWRKTLEVLVLGITTQCISLRSEDTSQSFQCQGSHEQQRAAVHSGDVLIQWSLSRPVIKVASGVPPTTGPSTRSWNTSQVTNVMVSSTRTQSLLLQGKKWLSHSVLMKDLVLALASLAVLCMLVLILGFLAARGLGAAVQEYIETIDVDLFGVDVHIDNLSLNPFTGRFRINGLLVDNPKGYTSSHLLKVSKTVLVVDVWEYLRSGLVRVKIQSMVAEDVDVVLEKNWTTSNAQDVIHHIYFGCGTVPLALSGREYSLHRVLFENVVVTVRSVVGPGAQVRVGHIGYSNFAEEVESTTMEEILKLLLQGLLNKILAAYAARRVQRNWTVYKLRKVRKCECYSGLLKTEAQIEHPKASVSVSASGI